MVIIIIPTVLNIYQKFLIASNDKMLARAGVDPIPVCAQAQDTNP